MNTRTVSTDYGSYTFMRMPNQPAIALCYGFTVDAAYRGRGLGERDDRRLNGHSQSGIMFRVTPLLRNGNGASWYDADWFEPAPNASLSGLPREGD